jgi:hypothetical protein
LAASTYRTPVAAYGGLGAQSDQQVRFTCAGVADQGADGRPPQHPASGVDGHISGLPGHSAMALNRHHRFPLLVEGARGGLRSSWS